VESFVERLGQAVQAGDAAAVCTRIKQVLMDVLGGRKFTVPEAFLQPVTTGYARRCLFRDPGGRFSVVVMVWGPGQGTPLHDHAGHWCVECVYDGRIQVTSFELEQESPGRVCFQERSSVQAGIGAAGALIPPFEYHTIHNPFDAKAVTIHVYEGELTWCHAFEPLPENGWFAPHRHELLYTA
jgi:predicted metal-dependent enzyme (double-stranded beta helix superfamily)